MTTGIWFFSDEEKKPILLVQGSSPHELALREWRDSNDIKVIYNGFEDYGILDKLESLLNPKVAAGLGAVFIEPTASKVASLLPGETTVSPSKKVNPSFGKEFSIVSI